jgi:DNA-binding protein H-NS
VKNGKKKKEVDTTKLQQEAALRDEANERLFQTIEENKRNAVSHEEYLKQKQLSDENKE